jgi:large subunit ribosomal protein L4
MPRKAKRGALASAILSKFQDGEVVLVDRFALDRPSTKEVARFLGGLDRKGSFLLVSPERDENLYLSARNIPRVAARSALDLNAYDVLRYRNLVLSEDALSILKERLGHAAP